MAGKTVRRRFRGVAMLALALALLGGGCELIGGDGSATLPGLNLKSTALVRSPSWQNLAAYYFGIGATPAASDLEFAFDLDFETDNPNPFPIPTTEILTALSVLTGDGQEDMTRLGAICFTFCADDDPDCAQPTDGTACQSRDDDIYDIGDVPGAAVDGLVNLASDIATGQDVAGNTRRRLIPANAIDGFKIRFSVGVDPMLNVLESFVGQWATAALAGQDVQLDIPYRTNGTLWLQIPYLGRAGLGFGPWDDAWQVL